MSITPLIAAIDAAFGTKPPDRIGVAVSGGGDSIALLSALAPYARDRQLDLLVVTVDHGLRAEFRQELAVVTGLCQELGLQHHVEYWSGWDGSGNMQGQAREGRYALMADWAFANRISHIALGHTADDQAETVLMRLGRAAGVDGLSAMPLRHVRYGITWVRPFLDIRRDTLRHHLTTTGRNWADDPSNENRAFERVRMRDGMAALEKLGVSVDALVDVAANLRQAREALDWQTFLIARETVDVQAGAVVMDLNVFRAQPAEIRRRLLVHCLMWLSGEVYPARRDSVARVLDAIREGKTATLGGCQLSEKKGKLWIYRELNAVDDTVAEVGEAWDDRWVVHGPDDDPEIEVRALGFEGLSSIEGCRDMGVPRAALAVTPAVWHQGRFISAPLISGDDEWSAELEGGKDGFFAALLSH